jgi:hypothetical protein
MVNLNMVQFLPNILKIFCIILLLLNTKTMITTVYADRIKLECLVQSGSNVILSGQCLFEKEESTNCFSLSNIIEGLTLDGKPVPPSYSSEVGITDISICIVEKGKAEVRGLTTLGVNSRWGEAISDPNDKSCWIGKGFKICAWE